jgi:hypothetical protein
MFMFRLCNGASHELKEASRRRKSACCHARRYSILKHGIRSMSGTRQQLNGAAYGGGTYLSSSFHTSGKLAGWRPTHASAHCGCMHAQHCVPNCCGLGLPLTRTHHVHCQP